MGSLKSKLRPSADEKATKVIEEVMLEEKIVDTKLMKLLLLGAGESGKSTFFKQMVIGYGQGYSMEERKSVIEFMRASVSDCVTILLRNGGEETLDLLERFIACVPPPYSSTEDILDKEEPSATLNLGEWAALLREAWEHPAIKSLWEERHKYQVPESVEYFLQERVEALSSPDYIPNEEDLLRNRIRTTGVIDTQFEVQGQDFLLVDVGGQRSERKKWYKVFDGVMGVLFVAAVSEYDQTIYEDETTNRMDEALELFDEVVNNPAFQEKTSVILFLNKMDLFHEKIQNSSLKKAFPEYEGADGDADAAICYIEQKFVDLWPYDSKPLYIHHTCATDRENCQVVMTIVKDAVLKDSMKLLGLQ